MLGIEYDESACLTRIAAGHDTIRADILLVDPLLFAGRVRGLIASPPCTTFSAAGTQAGSRLMAILRRLIRALLAGNDIREQCKTEMEALLLASDWGADLDPAERPAKIAAAVASAALVAEPARFIATCEPEWTCMEQVPAVLPLWKLYAAELRKMGYSAWAGKINCADFGVPQARTRAILIASRVRSAAPPAPTHYDPRKGPRLEGETWVTMAAALGWGMRDRPYFTLATAGGSRGGADEQVGGSGARRALYAERDAGRWVLRLDNQVNATVRDPLTEPAPTIKAGHSSAEMTWVLLTNRDQREDGSRQELDPFGAPAPAFTAKSGGQWEIRGLVKPGDEALALHRHRGAGMLERGGDRRNHPVSEPAPTVTAGSAHRLSWVHEHPATAIQGDPRVGRPGHKDRAGGESQFAVGSVRITPEEAGRLQGFRWDYPWQGNKTRRYQQIGNAFPPRAAAAVIGAATGIDWTAALARHQAALVRQIAELVAAAQQPQAEGGEAA